MRALNRKLWRDLWNMRSVAMAIALVLIGGVSTFVMSLSTYDSLLLTRAAYYRDYNFAQVFVTLKRAPRSLAARIREIPGVDRVQTRVTATVNLDIPGFPDPVTGKLVSLPANGEPLLNKLYLRRGRLIESGRDDEVVISEAFAKAHGFVPGDTLGAIINGRRENLNIVGIALSPEYIYQIAPGAVFPDYARYGILWMARTPLANAYDMEDAFNDVTLSLSAGASLEDVTERLDILLETYGGHAAFGREDQLSHRFLAEELRVLETMAAVFPIIFLGVAAFLLNVVVSRLIRTQRDQIAILKAFGYGNLDIGLHYTGLVLMITLLGVLGGIVAGIWLGLLLSGIYQEFYRFPFLHYELKPSVVVSAGLISIAAGLVGTLFSVRTAVRITPAEGMRPEAPTTYRTTLIERAGLQRLFSQPTRMIARHLERKPVKSLLSVIGIACACGIVMLSNFQEDSVMLMVDVQYGMSQREDLSVGFVEPTSKRALHSLQSLPGVQHVEGYRSVPARLRFEHRSHRTWVRGVEPDGDLQRVLDANLQRIALPQEGLVLTDYLGKLLNVQPGESLTIEVLEGHQPRLRVPVVGLTKQYLGVSAYMRRDALNRLMHEGETISGAYLALDPHYETQIYNAIKEMPRIAGSVIRERAVASFHQTMQHTILFFTFVTALLGSIIAFGVIYNSARIAFSERSRELASLRVLGFTRGEIAYILFGELAVLTLVAIPLGFIFGHALCAYLASKFQSDLYRIPLVLEPHTYAFAALVVLVSASISAYFIARKLKRLDLVAVLKTRE